MRVVRTFRPILRDSGGMKRSTQGVFVLLAITAVVAAACTSDAGDPAADAGSSSEAVPISAEVASSDLFVDAPQRFLVGLLAGEGKLVSYGDVSLAFGYGGTAEAPIDPPAPGPAASATYLPTPGTPDGAGSPPTVTSPSDARGLYQARLEFDRPGIWLVQVSGDVEGAGPMRTTTTFQVLKKPALPAPGQRALPTENLTLRSDDAPAAAIDSRAVEAGGAIPDRPLHEWTIAGAMKEGVPALVTFATPVYCQSQFCGPVVDVTSDLERRYGDRAAVIHVEIWRDFQNSVINRAAADWLYRNDNLTEPWTYLIDADGTIVDRWGAIYDPDEVAQLLDRLPKAPGIPSSPS